MPNASQKASVTQTIGVTDVTINYFRPGVKGRKVWGDATAELNAKGEATLDNGNTRAADAPMVPYGHVWRTGANDATQFIITDDVMINGQPLAAGAYSLHTIPGKTEWTVVFNSVANQWGSFSYDAKKDTLRVKAKPQSSPHSQEWMLFTIILDREFGNGQYPLGKDLGTFHDLGRCGCSDAQECKSGARFG